MRAVRSVFNDEKKLSIAALSQTFPDRLIEQTTLWSAINRWNCSLVYGNRRADRTLENLMADNGGDRGAGGFETLVAGGLVAGGLPVVVVNPAQVRSFAQALGKRAKTDPIDAIVIAHFAEATKPQMRALPDAMTQLVAGLVVNRPFNCRLLSSTRMAALSKAVALAPSKLDGVVEMGRERPAIR